MSSEKPLLQSATAEIHSPLLNLPNEILQEIACHLPTDGDVLHFSQSCTDIWIKVFTAESAIWRDRFGKRYDTPRGKTSEDLKTEYTIRALVLNADIALKGKEDDRQCLWMEVIQSMLQEAVSVPIKPGCESKTLACLKETLKKVEFLSLPKKPGACSPVFYALQLCLTAFALDPEIANSCHRTDYDILTIYSMKKGVIGSTDSEADDEFEDSSDQSSESDISELVKYGDSSESGHSEESDGSEDSYEAVKASEPFIDHENLDLAKLLQYRSFWQRHLLNDCELTYNETFSALSDDLKPKTRKDDPIEGSKLSSRWLGYYSCIHPFTSDELETRQSCADCETHMEVVEVMELELGTRPDLFWPEACKRIIPLGGGPETKRVAFNGRQGYYSENEESNHVFGFTEDIEVAHGDFSGWKRICFAICQDVDDQVSNHLAPDTEGWVHIYEAVIIPGGRIMLGRWVDLKEPLAKGPFIFWDV